MSKVQATILEILQSARGEFVSSREICATLGTSRTAVWKHIHALQKQGYHVEAITNKGYCLRDLTDSVNAYEIQQRLDTNKWGRQVVYHESIDSTNSKARMLAEKGAPDGTLVIADEQTAGRGRLGRKWFSPPKSGVWMSLILRPDLSLAEAPQLTLIAAVATAKALSDLTGQQALFKWPNDILFDGKKVAGILTEVSAEGNHIRFVCAGIGINVNNSPANRFPPDLQDSVCSIQTATGQSVKRADVAAKVLAEFEQLYNTFYAGGGFAAFREELHRFSATLGRQVEIASASSRIAGIAENIDEYGALWIRLPDQRVKRVFNGDIAALLD